MTAASAKVGRWLESTTAKFVAVVLVVASIALSVTVQLEERHQSQCVAGWGDRSTARSDALAAQQEPLTSANKAEDTALRALLLAAINKQKAGIPALVDTYKKAALAADAAQTSYARTIKANPVPPAPRIAC
jgi:hypothetical protein